VAGAGAVASLGLLVLQAVTLKTFCGFCVVVDSAGILAGIAALAWSRSPHATDEPTPKKKKRSSRRPALADPLESWAWWVLALIAVAAPLIWPRVKPQPPIAPEIAALYVPGKINVIEFADFECPHCRRLHPELKKLIAEFGASNVNFVRMNLPLKSHVNARGAAKAAICAEKQSKGDAMADALFASDDVSSSAIRRLALELGIDARELDRCMEDPETAARLRREEEILRAAGFEGLPTTYIGAQRIVGARAPEVFREAFERAKRGEGNEGIPAWLFIALIGLLAGGTVHLGRRRP
jgi:protein-disulfide isomerase